MAEAQTPRNLQTEIIDIEKKNGLLEELNLHPKAISFIRAKALYLQIGVVAFFVLLGAWSYYDHYSQNKQSEASLALANAVKEKDAAGRQRSLVKVADDYAGTGAALWSRMEQGDLATKDKKYQEALNLYAGVYSDLPGNSSLKPMLEFVLAQTHENLGQLDKALEYYRKLAENKSFKTVSLPAQGRIFELKGDKAGALKLYQEAAADKELSGPSRSILTEKINSLQVAGPGKGN
ncbi:MAG: tetratricopeptide repeat protein [Desulfobulbaceae bacterium]|nr:tetratricopeptide repeat protein [Desulfobulbaceae bacterium]